MMGDTIRIPPEGQNLLTRRLLAQGVRLDDTSTWPEDVWRGDPNNFEYKREWRFTPTWESPCGLMIREHGGSWGDTWWRGTCWCAENDNPLFRCPTPGKPCRHRLPLPAGINCCFHRTERPWDEAQSVERLYQARQEKLHSGWEARIRRYPGWSGVCACLRTEELPDGTARDVARYDVEACINGRCMSAQCVCRGGAARDISKANIFYDLRLARRYKTGFVETEDKQVIKGLRVFDKAIARTDAEIALKVWRHDPSRAPTRMWKLAPGQAMEQGLERHESFFVRVHGRFREREECSIEARVENIRVAQSDQRDLMQDLQDVQEGIEVVHDSDLRKAAEEEKRERRKQGREARQRRREQARGIPAPQPQQMTLFGEDTAE